MSDAQPTPSAWAIEVDEIRRALDRFDILDTVIGELAGIVGDDPDFTLPLTLIATAVMEQRRSLNVKTKMVLAWGAVRMCDDSLVAPREPE